MSDRLFEPASDPPEHIDVAASQAAKRLGMDRASSSLRTQTWQREASKWLDALPSGTEFTTDDLYERIGNPDTEANRNNVVGAWVNAQATRGLIRDTGRMVRSGRESRHRNKIAVWRRT